MKYFLQDFTEKERIGKNFCLVCGVLTDTRDMCVLKEVHMECWKWYRQKGIAYKPPKWF